MKVKPIYKLLTVTYGGMEEFFSIIYPFSSFLLLLPNTLSTYLLFSPFISRSSLFSLWSFLGSSTLLSKSVLTIVSHLCYLNHNQITTHSLTSIFQRLTLHIYASLGILPYILHFSKKEGCKHRINQSIQSKPAVATVICSCGLPKTHS